MDSLVMVVALGAVVAGFVQGLSGFAYGLVAMSFWAWTLEPRLAATLAVFGSLTGQIIAAVTVRRGFDVKALLPFVLGGLVGIPLGVALLPRMDMDWFRLVLGSLLVVWCPAMLFAKHLPKITAGGRIADGVVGMAGGVMGGLGGFTGALPTLWCTLRGLEKDAQRAIVQNFNLSMLLVTMGTYLASGIVTRSMLPMFGVVAVAMLVPTLMGARLYIGISEMAFRKIVLGLLTASGVAMLVASVPKLLARIV
ncbi:putative membrane protein YfcA [Rhodoferax ferrireducens]|uniref:Probable membrane transporter protein n=1 Tax=Rhodoferax ferrireducens TaxID=192843 RepID=A0ABU2C8P4_9BURK|nr:sulfite exporter TauE/SafE family protein [Rhodoferax ferrireducens]MDR7377705.1 putative membrane protein YfcA [Rhodoferax ferrireducens]